MRRNIKGFSLVEVITASLIGAIVLTGIVMYIIVSADIMYEGINEATAQSNLRRILNMISDDVKIGKNLSGDDKSLNIVNGANSTTYTLSNGKLTRNGIEVIIIGAKYSNLTGTFNAITPGTPDMSGITGKYYSLNYTFSLSIIDDSGNIFSSGNMTFFSNCRNLP